MANSASAVIYGKHTAFGDFLALGLPHENASKLDIWLERVLPELRKRLGDEWEAVWSAAPPLCFWIGPSLLGTPLLGLFVTSSDKVGRRYPLIFGLEGILTAPPVNEVFDPKPYAKLWSHIAEFRMPEIGVNRGAVLLSGFNVPSFAGHAWEGSSDGTIWGQRGDGDLGRLFQDARNHDATQAQFTRSHWWQMETEEQGAVWLACNGLPDAEALEWLLTSGRTGKGDES